MPLLFALGQHKSLVEAQARLSGNGKSFVFLDDICIASMPDRASEVYTIVVELSTHAHIHLARQVRPDAVVGMGHGQLWPNRLWPAL